MTKLAIFPALLAAFLALASVASPAAAATIENGLYVAAGRSGEGYAIEEQGGRLTLAAFIGSGWYYANEAYQLNESGYPSISGTLYGASGGAAGTVAIVFTGPGAASITLGTTSLALQRFQFSDAANPLLGQWAFAYSIGTAPTYRNTFGGFVNFTGVGAPVNAGGTGFVSGLPGSYGGECYASGALAGTCLVVQSSSASFVEAYVIRWPTNEWRGSYAILTGSRQPYKVQGIRVGQPGEATAFGLGSAAGGALATVAAAASEDTGDDSATKLALDRAHRLSGPAAREGLAPELNAAIGAIAALIQQ